jgi:recombination protein RecT
MATTDAAKKALAQQGPGKEVTKADTLASLIRSMRDEIAAALPRHMSPDRMVRVATTVMRTTPKLSETTPQSFLGALMTCAQLGLEPGPQGLCWILPYKNNDRNSPAFGRLEAQFQLGYKGVIELARRSGKLAKITARTVYANEVAQDRFSVEYDGAVEHVTHRPILIEERGEPVLYYAAARLDNGEELFTALRPVDVEARHRKRSKAPDSPAWRNDFDRMAWKSCVVEMRWMLPQSPELEQALAQDGQVRTNLSMDVLDEAKPDFIDSTADEVPSQAGENPATPEADTGTGWPPAAQPPDTPGRGQLLDDGDPRP